MLPTPLRRWTLAVLIAAGIAGPCALFTPPGFAQGSVPRGGPAAAGRASDFVAPAPSGKDTAAIERAAASLTERAEAAAPETLAVTREVAVPVFLGGREIFRVRTGRDGLTPAERATSIRARLHAAVQDQSVPADSVRLVSTPEGVEVRLGKNFLWVLTPGDVEGMGSVELAALLADLPSILRDGIEKERAGRRPLAILFSVLLALGATLAAWVLARLLLAGGHRWRAWLSAFLPKHLGGIRFRDFEVLSQSQLTSVVASVLGRIDVVVGLVLLYVYLTFVFSLFPWTQGWSWLLLNFATLKLLEGIRGIGSAIPGLIVVAGIMVFFRWLTGLSDRFFDAIESGSLQLGGFHPELAKPSKTLLKIALWAIAVIVAYPYIPGGQSRAFQGVSLFLGVLVSLGSTGIVGNMIAGIVLTFSRSFRVGERVKIGDQAGDVVSLGFFSTKLRTIRNEEITLPNGHVASSPIVNYTRLADDPGLILHTEVTIGYDVDWRKVHAMMIEAAGKVEGIEKEPAPWVYQRSLNDYHISYELNCVTHLSHPQLRLYSRLHEEIQDVFAREGIEILSPGFHAIRDANSAILPQEPKGPRPQPWGFRVQKPPGTG